MPAKNPPNTPERIRGLADIANNLGWSWHREARALFRSIDENLWHLCRHNPVDLLSRIEPSRLLALSTDADFLEQYDAVMSWLAAEASFDHAWFSREHPDQRKKTIAYFCAEFGLHSSVPIYSGGLGVLAGDHCKAASDLGVPLVGVGILYRAGYFDQRIRMDGWQEDSDVNFDPERTPITPLPGIGGESYLAIVNTFGRDIHVRASRLIAGRTPIILLDTDIEENHAEDRQLLSKLYAGGPAMRLRQEWLLGVGGVRVLRALGYDPSAWHANEGHASFMLVERIRELTVAGMSFDEAVSKVRSSSTFTTHTPVPAGHDTFDRDQIVSCSGPVWEEMGIGAEQFLAIGKHPVPGNTMFHMTSTAIRLSRRINGVSLRHGVVTRELWKGLWPGREAESVPIGHVTNGTHLATWMANSVMELLDPKLGSPSESHFSEEGAWDRVLSLDDAQLWHVHLQLKAALMRLVREEARRNFAERPKEAAALVGSGLMLDPDALTIGFARRFATYKRANLMFTDVERMRSILVNASRPVQIIFAGKAHPEDTPGKKILQDVHHFTRDPQFEGRVAFLEDYDMHIAHLLVQGVDLWLNLPIVPMEASGTSGMKAALNGIPQLSTIDGWWEEGFDGTNGWSIPFASSTEQADAETASHFYSLLETEVVPRFYNRPDGIPREWIRMMKNAMRVAAEKFTARRMVEEYVEKYYVPSMTNTGTPDDPPTA
ncbi:MAG: alpha-glucan family phosphorylase [Gemmatimonadaceae bacterium]